MFSARLVTRLAPFVLILLASWIAACAPRQRAAPAQAPARAGGTVILALSQEPDTLNPYLASTRSAGEVHTFVVEGLIGVDDKGEYYPALAAEIPTQQNGGVSADGLTITYRLRRGVTWSDGQPFTCDDVLFTWQAVVNPKSGAVGTSGYDQIDSVTCPDPLVAVVKYKTLYAAYLVPFWAVLPRHATGDPAEMAAWAYNRNPVGTGPFEIKEWMAGDHIMLVPNPHYRDAAAGKPQLDSVLIRFVPSRDAALQLLRTGEVTVVGDLTPQNVPRLAGVQGVGIAEAPSPRSERLLLNLANPEIDAPDRPLAQPHPILGDASVREALELGIDKKEIVSNLLSGQAQVGTNELSTGWARCETTPSPFEPAKARQLLDDAGWRVGNDGIRVAQGSRYAADGTRLRLKLQGPSGDAVREQVEQLLLDRWKSIGVETYIENAPTATLFGTFASGSVARHGRFDILIYTTGPYVDPQSQVETYFASWQIPLASNRGAGYNYSRWINSAADQAIKTAAASTDIGTRRAAFCDLMAQVNTDRPEIYLYATDAIVGYQNRLQNLRVNVWKNLGWNSADWVLGKP